MNVAAAETVTRDLLPALDALQATLAAKAAAFADIVKIGRTHLQDATPLTLGQEFSGYAAQLAHARSHIAAALPHVLELAHRRHGRRHRAQHAIRNSATGSPRAIASYTGLAIRHRAQQIRGDGRGRRAWSTCTAR